MSHNLDKFEGKTSQSHDFVRYGFSNFQNFFLRCMGNDDIKLITIFRNISGLWDIFFTFEVPRCIHV